jgi:hypothetical protein
MERKNLLFVKKNCELSMKLQSLVDDKYKVVDVNSINLPDELKKFDVPFLIVKNVIKPLECENAVAYLENIKFYNQQTNNITKKIIQMKPIVNELDNRGINPEFKKISDDYTFIEDGKVIDKNHGNLDNIDDSKKIDILTDFNNETKLKESETVNEMKNMVLNRNRQLQLVLQTRNRR